MKLKETIRMRELEEDLAQKEVERKSLKRRLEDTTTALASTEQEINKEFQLKRETEREAQFLPLQEKTRLLEKELVKAKSTKEYLVNQRQRNILELAKVRAKADNDETYYQATIKELRSTLGTWKRRCQDIADEAEIQVRAATVETPFWKDRCIKLAWLANQALVDIPRSLRATEGMIDPTKTPREILQFLELCRGLYDEMKKMSAPP
ncbi:hypothetical protein CR513_02582, partial [Mucuna pruriens]